VQRCANGGPLVKSHRDHLLCSFLISTFLFFFVFRMLIHLLLIYSKLYFLGRSLLDGYIYTQTTKYNCPSRCFHLENDGKQRTLEESCNLVRCCHGEFDNMCYKECVSYMIHKVSGMISGLTQCGYTRIIYEIGVRGSNYYCKGVCRECFQIAYNIGRTTLTEIISKIKHGDVTYTRPFVNSTASLDPIVSKALIAMASKRGHALSPSQIGNLFFLYIIYMYQN